MLLVNNRGALPSDRPFYDKKRNISVAAYRKHSYHVDMKHEKNMLRECNAVVAGGTGSVGEGIVRNLLSHGATVIVPYRTEKKRAALEEYVSDVAEDRLHMVECSLTDEESTTQLKEHLKENYSQIDIGVACLGQDYYGYSLHNMPKAHWNTFMDNNLLTHFNVQHAIVSLMHDQHQGTYVMINGGASEFIAPEEGLVSIVSAAQLMMARVLKQEARATPVRIHSVVAYHPIKTRVRRHEVVPEWYSAEELGDYIARLHTQQVDNWEKTIHRLYSHTD